MKVIFTPKAANGLAFITEFIALNSSFDTAWKYYQRLKQFGSSLNMFPEKYSICRYKIYAKKNMHCATFDNTYIFVYKVVVDELVIFDIIHCKRLF